MSNWTRAQYHQDAIRYADRWRCKVICDCDGKGCTVEPGLHRRHKKPDGTGFCRAWRYPIWGTKGQPDQGQIVGWECPGCRLKTKVRWRQYLSVQARRAERS